MKNKKGFTLIELLVAITIIGIIMIMTLPAIRNLQRENQEKKFDDYKRTILEAAKVYEDQYEEDLFGRNDTGCAYIDYESLVQKKLLSTTNISGYECNNNNNGIIIRKIKGASYYEVYLTCNKGSDNKNLTGNTGDYNEIKNNHCNIGEDTTPPSLTIKCDGPNDESPARGVQGDDLEDSIYYYSYTNSDNKDEKRLPQLIVEVSDDIAGLEKNQFVTYEWKMYSSKLTEEQSPEYTEKNRTTFNIKDGDRSTSKKNVRIIEEFKKPNTTGKAIVDLRGENIVDRIGNKLDPQTGSKQCIYYYDNAKPKITITLTGASGTNYNIDGNEWINEEITTSVEVTDATENNIYSGINTDTFTRNEGKEGLSGGTATYTYSRTDDNRKETDTFNVCDKVGNCYSDTVNIRVDTTPPVCGEASTSAETPWINKNRKVTIGCSDNLSGCTKDTYSKTFGEGTTEIITIRDKAGNTTDCTVYTKVDKTDPVCISSGGDKHWRKESLTITGTCTDNLSGCKQATYTNDYSDPTSITNGFGGQACDVAGNCANCIKDQDVHIDRKRPYCHYINIKNQYKPNTPISLELKCTDDQAVHVCGNQTIGTTEWSSNETKEKQVKISGVTSDVSRKVQDKAGNTSICKIFVRAAKCESDCCESSDGKCTSAKCCGYEVENIK